MGVGIRGWAEEGCLWPTTGRAEYNAFGISVVATGCGGLGQEEMAAGVACGRGVEGWVQAAGFGLMLLHHLML